MAFMQLATLAATGLLQDYPCVCSCAALMLHSTFRIWHPCYSLFCLSLSFSVSRLPRLRSTFPYFDLLVLPNDSSTCSLFARRDTSRRRRQVSISGHASVSVRVERCTVAKATAVAPDTRCSQRVQGKRRVQAAKKTCSPVALRSTAVLLLSFFAASSTLASAKAE